MKCYVKGCDNEFTKSMYLDIELGNMVLEQAVHIRLCERHTAEAPKSK